MRLNSSVLKSLDAFLQPRPSLFLMLVVELVRLFRNSASTQHSSLCRASLCRGFLDDARLALHDCREGKTEVVTESVGNQRSLVWALPDLLVALVVLTIQMCVYAVSGEEQSKHLNLHPLDKMTRSERTAHVRLLPRAGVAVWLRTAVPAPRWLCASWKLKLITNGLFPFYIGFSLDDDCWVENLSARSGRDGPSAVECPVRYERELGEPLLHLFRDEVSRELAQADD